MVINSINIAIVNRNERDVSCLKYKIMLWRQFCNTVDLTLLCMRCGSCELIINIRNSIVNSIIVANTNLLSAYHKHMEFILN